MFISISDIYSYVQADLGISGRKTRPLEEGERLYLAGHVGNCSFQGQTFKTRCITSKITADPHKIEIVFNDYLDFKQWRCSCSCKAGVGGKCKHIVASLLYVYNLKELPPLSCTDVAQAWGKRKRAELGEVTPVEEFCHIKVTTFIPQVSESTRLNFLLQCLEAVPDSEAAVHFNKRNKLKLEVRHEDHIRTAPDHIKEIKLNAKASSFLESLRINIDNELKDCCKETLAKFKNDDILEGMLCNQGSTTWKCKRRNRITGTSCYSLYTYKKNDWSRKCESFFYPKGYISKEMKYGTEQEPQAIKVFENSYPHFEIKHVGLLICEKYPWLSYSPDGILYENNQPYKLLEIKCPYEGKSKTAEEVLPTLTYLNNDFTLKEKHSYYGQIQFGMALLNLKVCEFMIYFSKDQSFLNITVPFDENFARDLIEISSAKFINNMLHYICDNPAS